MLAIVCKIFLTTKAATVVKYACRATDLLLRYPIKAVVVACNTASAHALDALKERTSLPVLGVVEPGARSAAKATRSGRIGIAGTEATIRSGAYQQALSRVAPEAELVATPWPLLVPLAEEGWTDHRVTKLTLEEYLEPFVLAGVDTIVLGCTHYPVFKTLAGQVLRERFDRPDVVLVDSAEEVARELQELLANSELEAPERAGRTSFFCTDAPERFQRVGATFFTAGELGTVTAVDL